MAPLTLVWLSLAAWAVLAWAGIVFAVVRGLRLWRGAKRTGARLTDEVDGIVRRSGEAEEHLRRASESQERLQAALGRLGASRAALDVQLAAVREARAAVAVVAPFLFGK